MAFPSNMSGRSFPEKNGSDLGISAQTEMDVDLAPKEIIYGEAVHLDWVQ